MNRIKNWRKIIFSTGFVALAILFSIAVSYGATGEKHNKQTDLSGNWSAVVNDSTGRWDYTMSLSRASSGKWSGTMTFTLNGKSPTTTDVAIESLGGGKISFVWRPGKPNAQQFEGTYAKDKISVSGFGGQLVFARRK